MSETLEDSQGGPEREEAVVVVVVGCWDVRVERKQIRDLESLGPTQVFGLFQAELGCQGRFNKE